MCLYVWILCVLEGYARFLIYSVCIYQLLEEAKGNTAEIRRFNVKHWNCVVLSVRFLFERIFLKIATKIISKNFNINKIHQTPLFTLA